MSIPTLDIAKNLFDNFWSLMETQNEFYTGATWEYLYPDGLPGLGLYTSLSNPWGSAPTYIFEEYVLDITATEPGYKKWKFQPLVHGLDLNFAEGLVPVPAGSISASWKILRGPVKLLLVPPVSSAYHR